MATEDCKAAIEAAIGRPIKDDELEALATEFQARVKAKLDLGLSRGAAVREAGAEASEAAKFEAAKAEWRQHDNLIKAAVRAERGHDAEAETSLITPSERSIRLNSATTLGTIHTSLAGPLQYALNARIKKAGLEALAKGNDPAFELRVLNEIYRLSDPALGKDTGDAHAQALAKILADTFEGVRAMQNKEGAFIGKKDGYAGRNIWDMLRTRGDDSEAAFQKWAEVFGQNRTADFEGLSPEQIQSLLRSQWQAIKSGIFGNAAASTTEGAFSIANKVSQQRTINFDTPEALMNARRLYGKGDTLVAGAYAQIDAAAKNTALMQMFGSTPLRAAEIMHAENIRLASSQPGGEALADKIRNNHFLDLFKQESGLYDQPGGHRLTTIAANWRAFTTAAKLGQIVVGGQVLVHTHLFADLMSYQGGGYLESMARALRGMFPPGAEGRDIASAAHAGLDAQFHSIIRQFHTEGDLPGKWAGRLNVFQTLSGFAPLMNNLKAATAIGLTHYMGRAVGKTFDQLGPDWQNSFARYGIQAADWDVARGSALRAADGRMHLIPADIADPKVATKFQNYLIGSLAEGANEPTPWARGVVSAWTQPRTPAGDIARLLTQFKSFPVAVVERQWGRQLRGGLHVPGALRMASMMTAFGLLSLELHGLVINNEQQDLPTDIAGWAGYIGRGMVQGGAMGLLADAFGRDANKTGADFTKMLAGPTVGGPVADLGAFLNIPGFAEAAQSRRTSIGQHIASGAKTVAGDLTPNFWLTSAVYNYLVPYMIANMIHPGAVQRHERIMEKNNSHWIVPPR